MIQNIAMDEKSAGIDNSDPEEADISKLDMAAAVQAALFQDAVIKGPEWFKAAVQQRAAEAKSAPGAIGFDLNTPAARRDDDEKRRDREASDLANAYQQLAQQQQEREEWQRTPSTVGGVTMNGSEWHTLAERLRSDEDLRSRVMAAFMARGMTEREAEARYERAADVAEIMAIPPSQRTAEQKETVKKADADPSFKTDIEITNAIANDQFTPQPRSGLQNSFGGAARGPLPTERLAQPAEATPERQVALVDGPGF